jgi:GxxExxY protein
MLEHEKLSGDIIAAAIAVHRNLGPGFLEAVYENALCLELRARNVALERQLIVPVFYRSSEVGAHRLDLVVDERMVVELKAIKTIENIHFAVVRSYLTAIGLEHGLILNFAKLTLEIKRVRRLSKDTIPAFMHSSEILPPESKT